MLRAEGAYPVIEINFGNEDPKPGTDRKFKLVVTDAQGNKAEDWVTITLREKEPPPYIVMGTAYRVDGSLAEEGTLVQAFIDGEVKGSDTVRAGGEYGPMQVSQGKSTEITFMIGQWDAVETAIWEEGGAAVVNLTAISDDPAIGRVLSGTTSVYEFWGWGGPSQNITVGKLDDGRWYIASYGAGDDAYDYFATVYCDQGEHWEHFEVDGVKTREGCVGHDEDMGDLVVLVGGGGWVVSDNYTYQRLATLIPRGEYNEAFEFVGTKPASK